MEPNTAKKLLAEGGFTIRNEERLANDTGTQLRLDNGAVVNVFDTGNHSVQGQNTEQVKELLGNMVRSQTNTSPTGTVSKIFVVYGHDQDAKDQMETLLRRWNLEPLFLDQLPSEGQTIIEKLEKYTGQVSYAIVLATPDDEGHRVGHADERAYRVRQNVVLELGMVLSRLGRRRVAILLKESHSMEKPSDIQGLLYIPFKDRIEEARLQLSKELDAAGYHIPVRAI